MKKIPFSIVFLVLCILTSAQVPESFSYQVVVRDGLNPLTNKDVSFQMSILKGGTSGDAVYTEYHSANTGELGIVNLVIGNGTGKVGDIAAIDWGSDSYFLKVSIDKTGGTTYVEMGTTQLLSVPYALYSKNAADKTYVDALEHRLQDIEDIFYSQMNLPEDGLILFFPFDGTANDESGYGNDGTVTGALLTTDRFGNPDQAYDFNGTSDIIEVADDASLNPATISISCWIFRKGEGDGYFDGIVSKYNMGVQGYLVAMNEFSNAGFWIRSNTGENFRVIESNTPVPFNKWMHITATFGSGKMKMYIDGQLQSEIVTDAILINNSNSLTIGRYAAGALPINNSYFKGAIDDIRIYNRELSETEIRQLYHEGGYPFNVTDINGNSYNTIKIGTQTWMAENLKSTKYSNGDLIPNITDNGQWQIIGMGAWRYYLDDEGNDDIYGKLYNWQAVADERHICPVGWHIPSDDEWNILELYLGMDPSESTLTGWRGGSSDVGGKMKASGTDIWSTPNTGATNESGFSALPGGRYNNDGTFIFQGSEGTWWSSTLFTPDSNLAWLRILNYDNNGSLRGYPQGHMTGGGFSVRCIKD